MVSSRSFSRGSAQPRWATPATPGRPNLAGEVAWTATALGFQGLMAHQRQIIATGTERLADGGSGFTPWVFGGPRQEGKTGGRVLLVGARAVGWAGGRISLLALARLSDRR